MLALSTDYDNGNCLKQVKFKVNEPGRTCGIESRKFKGRKNVYHLSAVGETVSCSMGYFSHLQVYEFMTNQPLCLSCLMSLSLY